MKPGDIKFLNKNNIRCYTNREHDIVTYDVIIKTELTTKDPICEDCCFSYLFNSSKLDCPKDKDTNKILCAGKNLVFKNITDLL